MSFRTLAGIFFLGVAIVTPWLFRDWLPHSKSGSDSDARDYRAAPAPSVTVPPLNKRERRSVPAPPMPVRAIRPGAILPSPSPRQVNEFGQRERIAQEMLPLSMKLGAPIFIRVFKEEKELELWIRPIDQAEFSLFRMYRLIQDPGPLGPPHRMAGNLAPEGFYYVTPSRLLSSPPGIDLGYPNPYDRIHGAADIKPFIGGKVSPAGSYSIESEAMEEVSIIAAAALAGGQSFFRVHCLPFRMDDRKMDPKLAKYPPLETLWVDLKEGYDFFEVLRIPPDVTVLKDRSLLFTLP